MGTSLNTSEREPKTVSEFAAFYKARNFNNFFCCLPGGMYRSIDRSDQKLFDDLDSEAARLEIDTSAIYKEMAEGNRKVSEAISLLQQSGNTETAQVKTLSDEGEALRKSAHQKMIPLFDALVALGYHPNELVS